eukprot:SAG31_NODE_6176_length_2136_cov_1.407953_1_plen_388_part_10
MLAIVDGDACAAASPVAQVDRQPRCARIRSTISDVDVRGGQARHAGFADPAVLQSVHVHTLDARQNPTFAAAVMHRGARGSGGWGLAPLPIVWLFDSGQRMRRSLRATLEANAPDEILLQALLNFGKEIPDAWTTSTFTLAAYLNSQPDCPHISNGMGPDQYEGTLAMQEAAVGAARDGSTEYFREFANAGFSTVATSTLAPRCDRGVDDWAEGCIEVMHPAFEVAIDSLGMTADGRGGQKPPGRTLSKMLSVLEDLPKHLNDRGVYGQTVLHRLLQVWGKRSRLIKKEGLVLDDIPNLLRIEADTNPVNQMMRWMLAQDGVDLKQTDELGANVLQYAVKLHNYPILQEVVKTRKQGLVKELILQHEHHGNTALHLACAGGAWHSWFS